MDKTPQQILQEAREEFENFKHSNSCESNNSFCTCDFPTYYKNLFASTLQSFIEAEIALLESKKRKIELSEPRLYQSNSTLNEMGGYSSVPFYCSLCQMNEMDIQDNKLGVLENDPIHYACHCSVWDSPTGGKWVRWYDKEKAEQILRELPSEDNAYNQAISDQIPHLKELLERLKI